MRCPCYFFVVVVCFFGAKNNPLLLLSADGVERQDSVLDCYFVENMEPKKQPICDVITKEIKKSKLSDKVKCSFLAKPSHLRKNVSLDEQSGIIFLNGPLDREAICSTPDEECFIKVDVVVKSSPSLKIIKVRLRISDVNDNPPSFPSRSQHFEVSETAEPGASFILPEATDPDSGRNGLYGYRLVPPQENFELLPLQQRAASASSGSQEILIGRAVDGSIPAPVHQQRQNLLANVGSSHLRLSLKNHLDREVRDGYIFKIEAFDGGDPRLSSSMTINISVLDSNDNAPQFENSSYEIHVREDVPVNTTLLRLRATDPDRGQNGLVRYHFSPETASRHGDVYRLGETDGRLTTGAALDYETGHLVMLYVTASDQGAGEKLSSQALVVVKLEDVNDNPPLIKINSQSQPLLQAHKNKNQTPRLGPGVSVRPQFDGANNTNNNNNQRSRNLTRADSLPQVFENSGVGTFVAHITVEDADSDKNGKFRCNLLQSAGEESALEGPPEGPVADDLSRDFLLSQMYQTEFKLITARIFDRETSDRERAIVHCSDFGSPPLTSTLTLNVQILDRNDNAPTFSKSSYEASANEDAPIGTSLVQVTARDADEGPNGEIVFALSSPKNKSNPLLEIEPTTGIVRTARTLELRPNATKFEVTVVATDRGAPAKSSSAKLVVHVLDVTSERADFTQQLYRFSVKENSNSKAFVGKVEIKSFSVPSTRVLRYFLTTTPCRVDSTYHAVFEFANLPFRIEPDKGSVWSLETLDREEQEFYSFFVVAHLDRKNQDVQSNNNNNNNNNNNYSNNYKFGASNYQAIRSKIVSCAVVEIVVEDQNDNAPYFTFPSSGNDHVYFSVEEAPGLAVTKLSAYDPDFVHNANLKFSIEAGNEDDLFELESSSGMLFLSRYIEMSDVRGGATPGSLEFQRRLTVTVTDQGFPPLNSSSVLVLVARNELHSSASAGPSDRIRLADRGRLQGVYHLLASEDLAQTLAITLAVILVLISSLVAAICLIKNKQRRRESGSADLRGDDKAAHKSSSCDNDIGNATSKLLLLSGDAFPRPHSYNNNNNNNNSSSKNNNSINISSNINNNNNNNNNSSSNNNKGSGIGLFGNFRKKKYQKAAVENHYGQSNELAMSWRPFYSLNIAHDERPVDKEETESLFHPIVNVASTSTSRFEFPTKIIDISSLEQEAIDPVNTKQSSVMTFVRNFYNDLVIKATSPPTSESNSDSGRGQSSGDDVTKASQRHVIFGRKEGSAEDGGIPRRAEIKL